MADGLDGQPAHAKRRVVVACALLLLSAACSNNNSNAPSQDNRFSGIWTGQYTPTACTGDVSLCGFIIGPPPLPGPVTFNVSQKGSSATAVVTLGSFTLNSSGSVLNNVLTLNQSAVVTLNTGSSASLVSLSATVSGNQLQGTMISTLGAARETSTLTNVVKP